MTSIASAPAIGGVSPPAGPGRWATPGACCFNRVSSSSNNYLDSETGQRHFNPTKLLARCLRSSPSLRKAAHSTEPTARSRALHPIALEAIELLASGPAEARGVTELKQKLTALPDSLSLLEALESLIGLATRLEARGDDLASKQILEVAMSATKLLQQHNGRAAARRVERVLDSARRMMGQSARLALKDGRPREGEPAWKLERVAQIPRRA